MQQFDQYHHHQPYFDRLNVVELDFQNFDEQQDPVIFYIKPKKIQNKNVEYPTTMRNVKILVTTNKQRNFGNSGNIQRPKIEFNNQVLISLAS